MIPIRGPTDLSSIANRELRNLIQLRLTQLRDGKPYDPDIHGEMILAEPGDTLQSLEEQSGCPIASNPFDDFRFPDPDFVPVCEFIDEHLTYFEMAFAMSDEGAVAIFVPKHPSIDPELTAFCAAFAVPSIT
jgi:hypothetical protein